MGMPVEADVVELLHLSRLVGSLYAIQAFEDASEPLQEASGRLYRLIEHLGFDLQIILTALAQRGREEFEQHNTRQAQNARRNQTH